MICSDVQLAQVFTCVPHSLLAQVFTYAASLPTRASIQSTAVEVFTIQQSFTALNNYTKPIQAKRYITAGASIHLYPHASLQSAAAEACIIQQSLTALNRYTEPIQAKHYITRGIHNRQMLQVAVNERIELRKGELRRLPERIKIRRTEIAFIQRELMRCHCSIYTLHIKRWHGVYNNRIIPAAGAGTEGAAQITFIIAVIVCRRSFMCMLILVYLCTCNIIRAWCNHQR